MFPRTLAVPRVPRVPVSRPTALGARLASLQSAGSVVPAVSVPAGPVKPTLALGTPSRGLASYTVCRQPTTSPPHPKTVSDRDDGNFEPPTPPRTKWTAYTIVALLSLPFVLEALGVLDLLFVFGSPWPRSVRTQLREARGAEGRGDFNAAAEHFSEAERAARDAAGKTGHLSRLAHSSEEVLTKLAALAVARGQALEFAGRYAEAFTTYEAAFEELTRTGTLSLQQSNVRDDMRAVVLAKKLGDLASSGLFVLPGTGLSAATDGSSTDDGASRMNALADQYYNWAVEHMLPLALPRDAHEARVQQASGGQGVGAQAPPGGSTGAPATYEEGAAHLQAPKTAFKPLQHVSIPDWAASTDLGNAVESLASFYAASGHPERAAQLYNHAISLLRSPIAHAPALPSPAPTTPLAQAQLDVVAPAGLRPELDVATKCHAGLLFYRLVDVLLAAADRPWREQGSTRGEAEARQKTARERALASAREGLALVRATEAEVGVPPSPDPVTTVGRGSVAPLPTTVAPPAPAAAPAPPVSFDTADECRLAEAGLLFALGRTIAAQTQGPTDAKDDPVTGLYAAAEQAATPIAKGTGATSSAGSVREATRESATQLLSTIVLALAQEKKA